MSETQNPKNQENEQTQTTQKTTKQKKPVKHGLAWYDKHLSKLTPDEFNEYAALLTAHAKEVEAANKKAVALTDRLKQEDRKRKAAERQQKIDVLGIACLDLLGSDATVDDLKKRLEISPASENPKTVTATQDTSIADHLLKVSLETLGRQVFKGDPTPGLPAKKYLLEKLDAEDRQALIEYIRANDINFPES